jgi:hypothetical protein
LKKWCFVRQTKPPIRNGFSHSDLLVNTPTNIFRGGKNVESKVGFRHRGQEEGTKLRLRLALPSAGCQTGAGRIRPHKSFLSTCMIRIRLPFGVVAPFKGLHHHSCNNLLSVARVALFVPRKLHHSLLHRYLGSFNAFQSIFHHPRSQTQFFFPREFVLIGHTAKP